MKRSFLEKKIMSMADNDEKKKDSSFSSGKTNFSSGKPSFSSYSSEPQPTKTETPIHINDIKVGLFISYLGNDGKMRAGGYVNKMEMDSSNNSINLDMSNGTGRNRKSWKINSSNIKEFYHVMFKSNKQPQAAAIKQQPVVVKPTKTVVVRHQTETAVVEQQTQPPTEPAVVRQRAAVIKKQPVNIAGGGAGNIAGEGDSNIMARLDKIESDIRNIVIFLQRKFVKASETTYNELMPLEM